MPKTAVAAPVRVPTSDESHWLDHLTRWREAGVCLAAYARSANLKFHRPTWIRELYDAACASIGLPVPAEDVAIYLLLVVEGLQSTLHCDSPGGGCAA